MSHDRFRHVSIDLYSDVSPQLPFQRHVTRLLQFQLTVYKFNVSNFQRLNYILKVTCLILTGVN